MIDTTSSTTDNALVPPPNKSSTYDVVTFSQLRNKLIDVQKQANDLHTKFYMSWYEELLLVLLNRARKRRKVEVVTNKQAAALGYHDLISRAEWRYLSIEHGLEKRDKRKCKRPRRKVEGGANVL